MKFDFDLPNGFRCLKSVDNDGRLTMEASLFYKLAFGSGEVKSKTE